MDAADPFTPEDLEDLTSRGLPLGQVEEQLLALRQPPTPVELVRPCRRGDGVRRIAAEEEEDLALRWREAAEQGRLSKFVPASGAATRMFAAWRWLRGHPELWRPEALRAAADETARQAEALLAGVERLPFFPALAGRLGGRPRDDVGTLLAVALDELGLDEAPKGLLPFHLYPEGARTAFEEHLVEGAGYLCAGARRTCRVHFTVSPEHLAGFAAAWDACRSALEERLGARFDVDFSTQARATDTLAVGPDLNPARRPDGKLLFRPSGHGALLRNLAALGGDIVFIKNIDNLLPEPSQPLIARWQRLLAGLLLRLQEEAFSLQLRLAAARGADDPALGAVTSFLAERFGVRPPLALAAAGGTPLLAWARERLRRPLRVCGMVPARGEPGGGPFWVRDRQGAVSPQIVEGTQVDLGEPGQRAIWEQATHFNPVNLACALLDLQGKPYDLERYVDPTTSFVADKSWQGVTIKSLERPGLWNGGMAGWNTVFVEVPAETFAPVKTALDLLRPEHQPAPATR